MAAPARAAPGAASPSPPARPPPAPGRPPAARPAAAPSPALFAPAPPSGWGKVGGAGSPSRSRPEGSRGSRQLFPLFFCRRRHRARSGSSRSAFPNPCPDPRGLGGGDRAGERDGRIPNNSHLLSWQKVLEQKEDLKPVLSAFAERQLLLPRSGQDTLFSRSLSRGVKGTGCLPEGERRDLKPVMCDGGDTAVQRKRSENSQWRLLAAAPAPCLRRGFGVSVVWCIGRKLPALFVEKNRFL